MNWQARELIREEDELERQLNDGEITMDQYNRRMIEVQCDWAELAQQE